MGIKDRGVGLSKPERSDNPSTQSHVTLFRMLYGGGDVQNLARCKAVWDCAGGGGNARERRTGDVATRQDALFVCICTIAMLASSSSQRA